MALTTQTLDPFYFGQNRVEFRLDPLRSYRTELRLGNIGIDQNAEYYPYSCGLHSLFRRISLYDGNIQIDSVSNVGLWMAFRNQLKDNDSHNNKYNLMYSDGLGYGLSFRSGVNERALMNKNSLPITSRFQDGYVQLNEILPFLKATTSFKFKNPRLIIEWETNPAKSLIDGDLPRPPNIVFKRPVLFCDMLTKDTPMPAQLPYSSMELDRWTISTAGEDEIVSDKQRINGFNGKFVNRMLMALVPSTGSDELCDCRAVQQKDEQLDIFINGKQYGPGPQGINSDNKHSILINTWGDINVCLGNEKYAFLGTAETQAVDPRIQGLGAEQGWIGFPLEAEISDLELVYKRTGGPVVKQQELTYCYIYGEVQKSLSFNKDGNSEIENL